MSDKKFRKGYLFGALTVIVIVGIIFIVSFVIGTVNELLVERGMAEPEVYDSLTDKLDDINEILDARYYEAYDEEEMMDSALSGYLKGVGDPYTTYYSEEDLADFMDDSEGKYEGIGVVVGYSEEGNLIEVISPFIDSPGAKAGLLPGDLIIAVDGVDVTQQDLTDVVKLIKGEKGTEVVLTIYRSNEEVRETIDVSIIRDSIETPTVNYELLENNIGYLQITGFKEVTYNQFMEAYNDLESMGQEGMIIDLRNNPGGYLEIVNAIADELLPEGLIVYTEDKYGNKKTYESDEEKQFTKPIVVLINENSASASEILSGAIKDYNLGTLVGETTYGKGLVQTTMFLQDGTAIKLTIERYFTPNGNYIHEVGIEPDVVVELPEDVDNPYHVDREEDTQLDKAIEIMEQELNIK